ncbi:MAG: hypothetical protein RL131_224 [Bacteroidota bacterium]
MQSNRFINFCFVLLFLLALGSCSVLNKNNCGCPTNKKGMVGY